MSEEKIPEELRSFYRYVNNGEAGDDTFTLRIKELVDRANESAEVQNMITFAGDVAAKEKKLEMVRKLKAQGVSLDVIAAATGLELAEIEAL